MTQRAISARFPYLSLYVQVGQRANNFEALLDTGFDGDITVPAGWVSEGDAPHDYLTWSLADGTEIVAAAYLGTARLDPFPAFPVVATVLGEEPLVGRGVSDRFIVTLDHGQRLIVEP